MGGDKLAGVIVRTWSSPNAGTGDYSYETYTGNYGSTNMGTLPSGVRHATVDDCKEMDRRSQQTCWHVVRGT